MQDEKHVVSCPHCNHPFDLDSTDYYKLAAQVRNSEFEHEVQARVDSAVREERLSSQSRIQLLTHQLESEQQARMAEVKSVSDRAALELQACKDGYETRLRAKDEEVSFYRDFKARQSTKAIGESLELYCESQFNQVRAIAFPGAYFEKDNEVSKSGSKGDYIFRDFDSDGSELVSIMFEMKNESDSTDARQRHKNADFFKELDKDRREKKCEYAILVTMLEADSDLYNQGIVDVSHRYPKMYVIRPQFFIPVIGFIRNAALQSLDYRRRIVELENQNLDVAGFESRLDDFKAGFERNRGLAVSQMEGALAAIDKAIADLQKTRDNLQKADRNLRLAGDKLDGLTIQKLVRGSTYMAGLFKPSK